MAHSANSVSRVVALEEAFLHPRAWEHFPEPLQRRYAMIKDRVSDVGPERIRAMTAAGVDFQVLSHVSPGVQLLDDADLADSICREVNDWLADTVSKYPESYAGFAMLPTQSPELAADELERCVTRLGFKGALINGHTHGVYLDHPSYGVLLERAQRLAVPIYIHPTDSPRAVEDVYYNSEAMAQTWGWLIETGTHLLRLINGGVFDRYPDLKIIVGHMGELIPYCFSRLESALTMGNWLVAGQAKKSDTDREPSVMQQSFSYYMRHNVFVTCSGVFDQAVFDCARAVLGLDNLMFSVDYPFQDNFAAMEFLNDCPLSAEDKERFAHGTAERLLKLDGPADADRRAHDRGHDRAFVYRARIKSRLGRALIAALVK